MRALAEQGTGQGVVRGGLRVAVVVLGLSATLALALSRLVPWAGCAAVAVLLVLAAAAARLRVDRTLRAAASSLALALLVALALATDGLGSGLVASFALGAVGLLVVQQSLADTLRENVVTAALGLALLLLALGLVPVPALAAPLAVGWSAAVAVAVLAHAHPQVGRSRLPVQAAVLQQGEPHQRSALRAVARVSAVTTLLGLLVVLLLPVPDQAVGGIRQLAGLGGPTSQFGRDARAYSGGDLDMRARGALPDALVARVPANSPRLWRIAVLARYDGTTWRSDPVPGTTRPTRRGQDFDVRTTMVDADPAPAAAGAAAGSVVTYQVRDLTGRNRMVLAPGHPATVTPTSGGLRAWGSNTLALVREGGEAAADGYTVRTRLVPDATAVPGPAPGSVSRSADDPWTALPETTTARTRALARQITATARTRGEQVAAIERYLARGYPYTLSSPVPPAGQDAVDHFLFDARTGFCEQFAAAEVVLLRSLGVPARLATGFSADRPLAGSRELRAAQAHAWVEVLQPGVGWTPSDPTPSSAQSSGPSAVTTFFRHVLANQGLRYAAAGVVAVLAAAVLAAGLLRARRAAAGAAAPTSTGWRRAPAWEVVAALTQLLSALEQVGRPSPPGETVAELAARVPEVQPEVMRSAEAALYGPRPLPPAERDRIVLALGSGRAAVLSHQDPSR